MAAQAASTNNRRVTRSPTSTSTTTTTTTLTPSTKSYATPPSQTIPSSSSSTSTAIAPTLVDAFASLAVEVPLPQQQEVAFRTAKICSQNASQSAKPRSEIATRSIEPHSLTTTQLAEPRPLASVRPTRTNRRDDKKQQGSLRSGTKVHSDPVDRLVNGMGAVQIHQPLASTHSEAPSPPVLAKPPVPKRSRSDYEEESPIDECLAKLYLDTPPPPETSTSASISTPTTTPLSITTKTTSTSILHGRSAKTSSKNVTLSADKPTNVEADAEPDHEIPLTHLIERRLLRRYPLADPSPTNDPLADPETSQRLKAERTELYDLHIKTTIYWGIKNPGSRLPFGEYFGFGQQQKGSKRSKPQLEADEIRVDMALHSLRVTRQYHKLVDAARTCELNQRHDAYMQYLCGRSTRIELQRKYEQVSEQRLKSVQDAWNKAKQQHRQLSQSYHQTPSQYKQGLEDLVGIAFHPWSSRDLWVVQSSSMESVSGSSRKDEDKTSKDQERRKRVKHDDIKREPVDEKMSDAATASTSFPTTTSAVSTRSPFSTSSGHTVADVTLDVQHKLTFNPTTATSQ